MEALFGREQPKDELDEKHNSQEPEQAFKKPKGYNKRKGSARTQEDRDYDRDRKRAKRELKEATRPAIMEAFKKSMEEVLDELREAKTKAHIEQQMKERQAKIDALNEHKEEGDKVVIGENADGKQIEIKQSAIDAADQREGKWCYWHITYWGTQTPKEINERAELAVRHGAIFAATGRYETGEEKITPHHQIFAYSSAPVNRSVIMQAIIGHPIYYCRHKYQNATRDHGLAYCFDRDKPGLIKPTEGCGWTEAENPWSVGDWEAVPKSGNMKLTQLMYGAIKEGTHKTELDFFDDKVFGAPSMARSGSIVRYGLEMEEKSKKRQADEKKGIVQPTFDLLSPRTGEVIVTLHVGETGAGKSVWCMIDLGATYEPDTDDYINNNHIYLYTADHRNKWNDYRGEEHGHIEDHDGTEEYMPIRTLMGITGGRQYKLDCHAVGGSTGKVTCKFKHITISSNVPLEEWYPKAHPARRKALLRRINNVCVWTEPHPMLKKSEPTYYLNGVEQKGPIQSPVAKVGYISVPIGGAAPKP